MKILEASDEAAVQSSLYISLMSTADRSIRLFHVFISFGVF